MRAILRSMAVVTLVLAIGCTPPPGKQVEMMKTELTRYFANLNRDAEMRKLDLKTPRGSHQPISMGRQFSDFVWHPDLVVLTNVTCHECKASQTIPGYWPGSNPRILCPKCGAGDEATKKKSVPLVEAKLPEDRLIRRVGDDNYRRMFDASTEGAAPKQNIKKKIYYIRRQWVYDASARVDVGGKAGEVGELLTSAPYEPEKYVDIDGRPSAPSLRNDAEVRPTMNNYYYGGFHRLDVTYLGEMEVEWDGGLKILSEHEEPIRPWDSRK